MASYRPPALMSSSIPDRRSVSLAPVNTTAPSGISSLTRVRAAAASSRIAAVKPCAFSAAVARSRRWAGAGSANDVVGDGVVMTFWSFLNRRMMSSQEFDKTGCPSVRRRLASHSGWLSCRVGVGRYEPREAAAT